jgi:hypothetical protein
MMRRARLGRPFSWIRFGAAVGLILVASLRGAAPTVPPDDRPVALPPFIVEEPTKGPPWRYAEAMGYEILSRCDDRVTRRVVEAHAGLHHLLAEVLPRQFHVTMSVPRQLILYDEELQPAASKEVIARMLRRQSDLPQPEEIPMPGGRGGFRVPASAPRISFLPNLRLWDRDSMAVFMIVRRDDFDADRLALTSDYIAFLVKNRIPSLPPWFVQGFLALYQQMNYGGGRLTLEPLTWISESDTDAVKKDPKLAPPVQPIGDFLAHRLVPRDPAGTSEPIKVWQAQAALFVRWGIEPNHPERRAAFWKFLEHSARAGAKEALFRECFGFDFTEAQAQLTAYLPQAVRRTVTFRPEKPAKFPPLGLHNASDGQIARIKGDMERLEVPYVKAIAPELVPKYLEQARRTLKRGYDRGERDPRLLAVLGLCEVEAGDDVAAREYLEAAVRIGPVRPRANYELARLRLAEFKASPGGASGGLNVAQTADVLRPLFAARADQPPLPEVYELIAEAWAHSEAKPTRAHLAVLHEGVRLFPRWIALVLRGAELHLNHGYYSDAAALVDVAVLVADDDLARGRIAALQQQLAGK